MRASRAPEKRTGASKYGVYIALIVGVVILGSAIAYFTTGFGAKPATGVQADAAESRVAQPPVQPVVEIAPPVLPEPKAEMKPVEIDWSVSEPEEPVASPEKPEVDFGEVLSEGFVEVDLPGEPNAQVWYTYQVDTVIRDITMFYAIYGEDGFTVARTVKIEDYTQGADIENAEVTLFYADGYQRNIRFDGEQGSIQLTQHYAQPQGPSMFSPELRVALVNQRMQLSDASGNIKAVLQLDLTGLSDSEQLVFQRTAPDLVGEVLTEIQEVVVQIDNQRLR